MTLLMSLLTAALMAGESPKFVSSGAPSAGAARYRVTLDPAANIDELLPRLLATCRCRQEPYAEVGFHGFVVSATPSSARLLSSDPRVVLVEELVEDAATETLPRPAVRIAADVSATAATPAPLDYATAWQTGTYSYDPSGNIKAIGTDTFTYDAFGRLSTANVQGTAQSYTYDRFGNQLTRTTGTTTKTLAVDASNNRLTSHQYDAAGRLTSGPAVSYSYDALDAVTASTVNGISNVHIYTASGERLASITLNAFQTEAHSYWTIRDPGGKVLRRYRRDVNPERWTWVEDYVHADGRLVAADVNGSEKRIHFHLDHLGSPRLITADGGMRVSERKFFPFGEEITATDTEPLKFTGHERDPNGIDYMHARYYDATLGRFLSVDPSARSVGPARPQTWNRYSYSYNNPLRYIDPDGQAPKGANFDVGRFSAHLDYTHSSRNPAPHVDVKAGKRVLGRFHFDKWAGEEGSKIPKSFIKAFEELAETGKLPGKVLRELAEHAPAAVKVFGRAAPVIGAVLGIVIADQANASETETFKRVSSLSQEMFGKKFGELTDDEKSNVIERFHQDCASDGAVQKQER